MLVTDNGCTVRYSFTQVRKTRFKQFNTLMCTFPVKEETDASRLQ